MREIKLDAGQSVNSVDDLAQQASKVETLLENLQGKMDTISNNAESDRIKDMAKQISQYITNNQEAIVGNIKEKAGMFAAVSAEQAKEDTIQPVYKA